jgi:ubiquinone/menaquinone biosynthesis C-methylase UbiE
MSASLRIALAVVTLGLGTGCGILGKTDVSRLITSGRDGFQHPERVVEALALREGDRVAEIGAGDGYWLPWLSDAVGESGRVYAVEVEDDRVASLRERVERDSLDNVVVIRGVYEDPRLPDGEVDLAMTCLTYHHIEDRVDYFRRLRVDLSPRGRVAHLDDRHDVGPPLRWIMAGHWSDPAVIRSEMSEAGYRRSESHDFLPVQSFQIFAPSPRD